MSIYKKSIIELTGCKEEEAKGVETVMRCYDRTLDALTRPQFKRKAVAALKELQGLSEEDKKILRIS